MILLPTIQRQLDSTGQNRTERTVPLCMIGSMNLQLSKDEIESGLAYCRWLHMRTFNSWMDSKMAEVGVKQRTQNTVCLNSIGKKVYNRVLVEVKASHIGGVMLLEGERKAVVKYLADLKDRKPSRATATPVASRGPVKHAKLQLSSITKFVGGGKRTIRGLANSGLIDRVGDIVEPKGGRWTLPVPLLWQHKPDQPIGWVRQIEARSDGLWITAELAEGIGKADEAWKMIEAGLVDSYSIGFQGEDWEPLPSGGKRFKTWSLLEISVVTIPADARAKIRRNAKTGDAVKLIRARQPNGVPGHAGAVRITRRAG